LIYPVIIALTISLQPEREPSFKTQKAFSVPEIRRRAETARSVEIVGEFNYLIAVSGKV